MPMKCLEKGKGPPPCKLTKYHNNSVIDYYELPRKVSLQERKPVK